MQSLPEREPGNYKTTSSVAESPGFTDVGSVTTRTTRDLLPHNASSTTTTTVYDAYIVTNITLLLSTASVGVSSSGDSFTGHDSVVNGSHGDMLTRVVVSCVSCVAILLVVVPLVIWRCRMFQQHTITTPAANKCGTYVPFS